MRGSAAHAVVVKGGYRMVAVAAAAPPVPRKPYTLATAAAVAAVEVQPAMEAPIAAPQPQRAQLAR